MIPHFCFTLAISQTATLASVFKNIIHNLSRLPPSFIYQFLNIHQC